MNLDILYYRYNSILFSNFLIYKSNLNKALFILTTKFINPQLFIQSYLNKILILNFKNNLKKNYKIYKNIIKITGIGWRHWILNQKTLLIFRVGHNFLVNIKVLDNIVYKNINRYFFKLLSWNFSLFKKYIWFLKKIYPTKAFKDIGIRVVGKKPLIKKVRSNYLGLRK